MDFGLVAIAHPSQTPPFCLSAMLNVPSHRRHRNVLGLPFGHPPFFAFFRAAAVLARDRTAPMRAPTLISFPHSGHFINQKSVSIRLCIHDPQDRRFGCRTIPLSVRCNRQPEPGRFHPDEPSTLLQTEGRARFGLGLRHLRLAGFGSSGSLFQFGSFSYLQKAG